ncbi:MULTISPECIES: beta-L-arabinofuranosidase domain-containing protein [Acidobacteriaceae]|uniref:beta-L-arabinofuranosidase domain-containing protein n=1 Tax=Acidobacteriaceae TaxID=204434 RepID=UPI00131B7093|nr:MULTISPECIES: beta-L-arabinofuranosidase domain-containing protein [Acidobacteriaceae]MDW5266769.1 glycoside hydrolase family 127 protein [Edaphobacter sp.]
MSFTRRKLLANTTYSAAGLLVAGVAKPAMLWADPTSSTPAPYLTGLRMAATPATAYRAYRSKRVANPDSTTWIQLDLGSSVAIEAIRLFPASEKMYPGRDQYYGGEGFPLRFKIEAADDEGFSQPKVIADFTKTDFPDPKDNITQYPAHGVQGRYVRISATKLRPVRVQPPRESAAVGGQLVDSKDFTLTIAKVGVLSGGHDIALGCKATADAEYGNTEEELKQLTRPLRQDGEEIRRDNPHAITDAAIWKPAQFKARVPKTGVTLGGGVFETAMRNNIEYLLNSYSTDDLLRQFYERTGKIKNFKATGSQIFWEEDLAGSNAGRFLMGAGNTVRWIDHPELQRRLNVVVDGIEECRQPNGYIMAYPEDTIFYSERAAYTRAWLTHGLLEAAYSGNTKALPMLRGYYDWFNQQAFLPEMLRGAIQGGQGMVANTRVGASPMGKPADAQVIQRYYQEDAWLHGLAKCEKEQVWQYPYDRPHCYLLTNLEAYLDMYLITGDPLYYDAVLGAWELYRSHWQQAGGSISIIEFEKDPPDSNYLKQPLGELCGSSFWVFLSQRFQMLHPDDERFATEIEKSIYNVGMANQDGGAGLRYHTILEGKKEKSTHQNTCCEGQGTRLLGSLPEHIYSIASDGLYVHLYEPSTIRWQQEHQPMQLTIKTNFPMETKVLGTIKTEVPTQANLRIRVPSWAISEMKISVNGKSAGVGNAGTYVALNRKWRDGDIIEFTLPAAVKIKRYTGADQVEGQARYSFEYGPILLAAVGRSKMELSFNGSHDLEHIASQLEPIEGSPLHFAVRGDPEMRFMPYWQISQEEFTCYPCIPLLA